MQDRTDERSSTTFHSRLIARASDTASFRAGHLSFTEGPQPQATMSTRTMATMASLKQKLDSLENERASLEKELEQARETKDRFLSEVERIRTDNSALRDGLEQQEANIDAKLSEIESLRISAKDWETRSIEAAETARTTKQTADKVRRQADLIQNEVNDFSIRASQAQSQVSALQSTLHHVRHHYEHGQENFEDLRRLFCLVKERYIEHLEHLEQQQTTISQLNEEKESHFATLTESIREHTQLASWQHELDQLSKESNHQSCRDDELQSTIETCQSELHTLQQRIHQAATGDLS